MWKRALLLAVIFFVVSVRVAAAQNDTPPTTDTNNQYSYSVTGTEVDAYNAAIQHCDTPSLECLVRNVTRFVAIEWVNDINGQNTDLNSFNLKTGGDAGSQRSVSSIQGGAVAGSFRIIGAMYSRPIAHTATYVADVANTAGFATPAYAQGLGFASLDPVLNLWKTFRNVAYFFFIIIFIIIGFMIMLRQRISGQAAVTAQQAIPSVIISLILVTFSYAISGFLIDLMYVLMFLIIGLFEGITTRLGNTTMTGGQIINFNILNLIYFFFTDTLHDVGKNITLVSQIFNAAGNTTGGTLSTIGGVLGGLTLTIVITVAVLIGTIRLFFELLKSYASIILYVVASPIILMFGAIPGKNVFGSWIKGIIGNLLAFPTVLLMVILYVEFTKDASQSGGSAGGFMPPFLFGNGTAANMLGPLLGLAIILALPDIVKEIKKAAGAGEGGIGSMLLGMAGRELKDGLPLGGRLSSAAIGGVPTALVRGGGRFIRSRGQIFGDGGALQAARQGFAQGTRPGIRLTSWASRSMGANQPDILNPITNQIDRLAPDVRDLEEQFQLTEDLSNRISRGGIGVPLIRPRRGGGNSGGGSGGGH